MPLMQVISGNSYKFISYFLRILLEFEIFQKYEGFDRYFSGVWDKMPIFSDRGGLPAWNFARICQKDRN